MTRENWDDLRFVLAVADEGSVSAAARRLRVNHATVLRRIAAYEDAIGLPIFDKTPRGYTVPAPVLRVIEAAREVDRAVQAVDRVLRGTAAPLAGEVRVTSTDSLCQHVLAPVVTRLRAESPELRVELICSNAHIDLGRNHADITVRPALSLPDDLVGEVAGRLGFGLYRGRGRETADWLGMAGQIARSRPGRWIDESVPADRIVARADSFLVLRELAAEGLGMAILPAFLGNEDARLERGTDALPDLSVDLWVASHTDLAAIPRIAVVRHSLAQALSEQGARLSGQRTG